MKAKYKYLSSHIVSFGASVATTLVLARLLGAAEFGRYGVWLAILNFLVPVVTFGMTPYIIRNIKTERYRDFAFYKSVRYMFAAGVSAGATILIAIVAFIPDLNVFSISSLAFSGMLVSAAGLVIFSAFNRAKNEPNLYFVNVGGQKITHLFLIVIAATVLPVFTVDLFFICGALAFTMIGAFLWFRGGSFYHVEMGSPRLGPGMRFCIPVILTNALVLALPLVERTVLVRWVKLDELGIYVFNLDLVAKFSASLLLIMKLLIFPSVMSTDKGMEVFRYRQYLKKVIGSCLVGVALLFIFSIGGYERVLGLISMSDYENARIFGLAIVYSGMIVVGYMISIGVMITGKTTIMTYSAVLMIVAHVAALYFTVPLFGIYGAGYSLVASQALYVLCLYLLCERELGRYVQNTSD